MDYFELFDIPRQFRPDTTLLRQKFLSLSRKYHPDFFIGEPEDVQLEALQKISLLNSAWKTFQDPDATIRYVLQLNGLIEEEEKFQLPSAFLAEVMELNEALMEAENSGNAEINDRVHDMEDSIYAPVRDIIENYDPAVHPEEALLQVKEYYFKKKYLDRMKREILEE